MSTFFAQLLLQGGYNSVVVMLGAAMIGAGAGAVGTFLLLRKRVLVSDAVSHATLPGIGIAFLVMAAFGGDGRDLPGLLLGAGLSAFLGLLAIEWLTRRTRLPEDSAIGAVLASFFGFGVVLLTIIQSAGLGKPAGLTGFLLGSTASMLAGEAMVIGGAVFLLAIALFALRRPLTIIAFDVDFAHTRGINVAHHDRLLLFLALFIIVLGLKVTGLILIVAMTILPPVAARFWTNRINLMLWTAALLGGLAGYVGAAISASAEKLPTGPVIVLVAFALFLFSAMQARIRAASLRRAAKAGARNSGIPNS